MGKYLSFFGCVWALVIAGCTAGALLDAHSFTTPAQVALSQRHEDCHVNENEAGVSRDENFNHVGWHAEAGVWVCPAKYDHAPAAGVTVRVDSADFWDVNKLCKNTTFAPPEPAGPLGIPDVSAVRYADRERSCVFVVGPHAYHEILPIIGS